MNSSTKRCLNCGNECHGAFCSTCGQPTHISGNINRSSFFKSVSKSISRMTPGFWNTLIGLSVKPWVVVHEYIHGKRVKYSEPVTMLIQLILYFTFIFAIIEYITGIDFLSPDSSTVSVSIVDNDGTSVDMGLSNFINSYPLICRLIISCIAAFNCYVIYRNQGSRSHNIYEFLIAAIYMCCTIMIYSSLLLPVNYFFHDFSSTLELILYTAIGSVAIFKAFKIHPWWKALYRWILFMLLNFVIIVALALIAGIVAYYYNKLFVA